jgi:peptide/nickel transport system ATP-binding protein
MSKQPATGAACAEPLLRVRDLAVSFETRSGVVEAVRGVDLSLHPAQCLAIVGESGSGKSVMARTLVGLAGPTATVRASQFRFEGQQVSQYGDRQWRRLRGVRIGFVLQDALSSLDPLRRIGDEVGEPLAVHRVVARRYRHAKVIELLGNVGIPEPELRARQYAHELSGGLRQRALIASAIAAGPSLVIADEPTTALDVTIQAQVLDLLATKRDEGTAVLLISHDLTVVARMADRIAVMYAGLIVEEGPAEQVLVDPAHPYTVDLLAAAPTLTGARSSHATGMTVGVAASGPGCPYCDRCVLVDDQCRQALPGLAPYGAEGIEVRCWHPGEARVPLGETAPTESRRLAGATIVEVSRVAKRFRSPNGSWRQAVDDVSFELRAGESLGIVGESGSGKTTTAQMVLGMLAPDSGEVRLDGAAWSTLRESERRAQRFRVQIVHQDPLSAFDPRFTVERIVGEALGRPGHRGAVASRERVVELLTQVGLNGSILPRRGRELSGGQRQRIAIARALATNPEVVVCDEPVSALDVSIQAQILDLLTTLRTNLGVALLFISHDLGVISQVCDRVLVMKDGIIVERGDVNDVFNHPRHIYTQSLLAAVTRRPVTATATNGTEGPPRPGLAANSPFDVHGRFLNVDTVSNPHAASAN